MADIQHQLADRAQPERRIPVLSGVAGPVPGPQPERGPHVFKPHWSHECTAWVVRNGEDDSCRAAPDDPIHVAQLAEPQSLVLSLPQVPGGTVALIGKNGVGESIRFLPHPTIRGLWVRDHDINKAVADCSSFGAVLADYGPLTVEFAPPRTWPRLDGPGDALKVQGDSGTVYTRRSVDEGAWHGVRDGRAITRSFPVLALEDGPLREVLDANA